MHGNAGDAWNAWKFEIWMVGLSQGHDPGHSDVHGQKLCDTVQEGGFKQALLQMQLQCLCKLQSSSMEMS